MKDITRIHIAKVPYSVELTAKKQLEKYIAELEAYTSDSELLQDIEIRITELLLERGVKQEDVISDADVTAIREQLGEPKEFMSDEAALEIDPEILSKETSRKFYRNLDSAVLGGVLSGIASYFQINALWVRLGFIALMFVSFGIVTLLYVVLWVIVPPARTAAEKLQMSGRPVTLGSIRELNSSDSGIDGERRAAIIKRVGTIMLGLGAVIGALTSIAAVVLVAVELIFNNNTSGFNAGDPYYLSFILAFIAGILLTVLFLLVTFAAFTQKFNKRILVSGVIIIVLGLSSFGGAIISAAYQSQLRYDEVRRNTVDTTLKLPDNFNTVRSLSVDVAEGTRVSYIVDDTINSLTQRSLKSSPDAKVTVENGVAKLSLGRSKTATLFAESTITIYGPRLDSILLSNGNVAYNAASQTTLKAEVYNSSYLQLVGSRIDDLTIRTDGNAQLSAEEAAVANVKVSIYGQSSVGLGNIKSLNVTNPDVCASNTVAQLSVQNIVSANYLHNGVEAGVQSSEGPCLNVEFAKDTAYGEYGYQD